MLRGFHFMFKLHLTWLLCTFRESAGKESHSGAETIQALYDDLLKGYNRDVIPLHNFDSAVQVNVTVAVKDIVTLDETRQELETEIWLYAKWVDHRLSWNLTEYPLEQLSMRVENIWIPDLYVQNSASGTTDIIVVYLQEKYPAVLSWNGIVLYGQGLRQRTSCSMDVSLFPFDKQQCNIVIGSWSHTSRYLNITPADIYTFNSTFQNHQWDVLGISSRVNLQFYQCCPVAPFTDVIYTIQVKRKPMFLSINIVLPSVMLAIMGNLGFLLPPESGERISLTLTTFLAFTVFQVMVASVAPQSSLSIPLITRYLAVVMSMTMLSLVWSVLVIRCQYLAQTSSLPPAIWWIVRRMETKTYHRCEATDVQDMNTQSTRVNKDFNTNSSEIDKYGNRGNGERVNTSDNDFRKQRFNSAIFNLDKMMFWIFAFVNAVALLVHFIIHPSLS